MLIRYHINIPFAARKSIFININTYSTCREPCRSTCEISDGIDSTPWKKTTFIRTNGWALRAQSLRGAPYTYVFVYTSQGGILTWLRRTTLLYCYCITRSPMHAIFSAPINLLTLHIHISLAVGCTRTACAQCCHVSSHNAHPWRRGNVWQCAHVKQPSMAMNFSIVGIPEFRHISMNLIKFIRCILYSKSTKISLFTFLHFLMWCCGP